MEYFFFNSFQRIFRVASRLLPLSVSHMMGLEEYKSQQTRIQGGQSNGRFFKKAAEDIKEGWEDLKDDVEKEAAKVKAEHDAKEAERNLKDSAEKAKKDLKNGVEDAKNQRPLHSMSQKTKRATRFKPSRTKSAKQRKNKVK